MIEAAEKTSEDIDEEDVAALVKARTVLDRLYTTKKSIHALQMLELCLSLALLGAATIVLMALLEPSRLGGLFGNLPHEILAAFLVLSAYFAFLLWRGVSKTSADKHAIILASDRLQNAIKDAERTLEVS